MNYNLTKLDNYLNALLPYGHDQVNDSSRWVYQNKIVSFCTLPSKQERKVENALEYINLELEKYYNADVCENENPEIVNKLSSLQALVRSQVDAYHKRHGSCYFLFRGIFYPSVDKLADRAIANIGNLKMKLNPNLELHFKSSASKQDNLLPLPKDAWHLISKYLNLNDLTNLTKTAKGGFQAVKHEKLLKAQELGFRGEDAKEAEAYLNALGKAVIKLPGFKKNYNDKKEIDLKKTLKTNLYEIPRYSFIFQGSWNFPEKDLAVLSKCWLHLIRQNEPQGIMVKQSNVAHLFVPTFDRALKGGNLDELEILFKYTVNCAAHFNRTHEHYYWRTLLQQAVRAGHEPLVKLLIQYKADVNFTNPAGDRNLNLDSRKPPLMLAMITGNLKIARLLLEAGAVPHATTTTLEGSTACHAAVALKNKEAILLLKEYKGNFEIPLNNGGDTPMQLAIRKNDLESVKNLLDIGVNINTVTAGKTALQLAFALKNKNMVEFLLEKNALLEYPGVPGSALTWACNAGFFDMAQKLIDEHGMDPNKIGTDSLFPLVGLVTVKGIEFLLTKGAKLNIEDANGHTPLSQSIRLNDWNRVDCFIKFGADINYRNTHGQTALDIFDNMNYWWRLKYRGAK